MPLEGSTVVLSTGTARQHASHQPVGNIAVAEADQRTLAKS